MKISKPSDLHAFLKKQGLHAKKGLSQNFLIDGNIVQKIVNMAGVKKGDFVVEIGPGPGALTQILLEKGANILAIEMDPALAGALEEIHTSDGSLEVVCSDILKFPLEQHLRERGEKKCKIIANLPYHITTPILILLLPLSDLIESLTIMVQKEFADRMIAKKRTPDYSSFTLFFQCYASVDKSFKVSRHCFYPRPKVDSSVVHCLLHPCRIEKEKQERFFALTRTAMGKRRKMLRSSLQELYGSERVLHALNILELPPTTRPEELELDQFMKLFEILNNKKH